ncbi:unnamed protein product, partial [Rhizoctonia solani]
MAQHLYAQTSILYSLNIRDQTHPPFVGRHTLRRPSRKHMRRINLQDRLPPQELHSGLGSVRLARGRCLAHFTQFPTILVHLHLLVPTHSRPRPAVAAAVAQSKSRSLPNLRRSFAELSVSSLSHLLLFSPGRLVKAEEGARKQYTD